MICPVFLCKHMNEQELCKKRLMDLSYMAEQRGIVLFSDFLNLNEQNIYHSMERELYTQTVTFGGYEGAERQMVAFIPDALCYEWKYPLICLKIQPQYPKFAEELSHRDLLGAVMHLGIVRGKVGDIVKQNDAFYLFLDESMKDFLVDNLTKVKHTMVYLTEVDAGDLQVKPSLREHHDTIASNRIDCIIAKAYHLSRSEVAEYLIAEKVFIDGRCITNCNQSCEDSAIVSVRGKGRLIFRTEEGFSKKGKRKVTFLYFE